MAKGTVQRFGICAGIVLALVSAQASAQQDVAGARDIRMRDAQRTASELTAVPVYRLDSSRPYNATARRAIYKYGVGTFESVVTIVAVKFEDNRVWVGPEQEIYLHASSGLIGARVKPTGQVVWCDSLVDVDLSSGSVDEAIRAFEDQVTVSALDAARSGGTTDSERAARVTDLRRVFGLWSFTNGRYSSQPALAVMSAVVDVSSGQLHLRLENPASAFVGDVWIDVETKSVVRATEAGAKVYPR